MNEEGYIYNKEEGNSLEEFVTFRGGPAPDYFDSPQGPIDLFYQPEGAGSFQRFQEIINDLGKMGQVTKEIKVEEQSIMVSTKEGWQLRLPIADEDGVARRNFLALFESEAFEQREGLEYIDLRFGNKVYYRYGDGQEEEQ
jgi:hypothetical protein